MYETLNKTISPDRSEDNKSPDKSPEQAHVEEANKEVISTEEGLERIKQVEKFLLNTQNELSIALKGLNSILEARIGNNLDDLFPKQSVDSIRKAVTSFNVEKINYEEIKSSLRNLAIAFNEPVPQNRGSIKENVQMFDEVLKKMSQVISNLENYKGSVMKSKDISDDMKSILPSINELHRSVSEKKARLSLARAYLSN